MRDFSILCLFAISACVATLGCEGQSGATSSPSTAASAKAINDVFAAHDVEQTELTLTTEEVVKRLGDAQKWTEFSVDEIGTGQYEGQAKSPLEELLDVEVRQTANGIYGTLGATHQFLRLSLSPLAKVNAGQIVIDPFSGG